MITPNDNKDERGNTDRDYCVMCKMAHDFGCRITACFDSRLYRFYTWLDLIWFCFFL